MVAQLTSGERQLSVIVLLLLAFAGLAMAVADRRDPSEMHGFVVLAEGAP